jgi:hypothetical protein
VAARQLFERSGMTASDVDAIVVASVTPSYLYSPPDSALLQHELGIPVWQGPMPRMEAAESFMARYRNALRELAR